MAHFFQVADFLQDEHTLASATAEAHGILVSSRRKRSADCMKAVKPQSMVQLSAQHVEELLCLYALQPQLAVNILRLGVSELQMHEWLYFWLLRLPPCCRQLILASVVEGSCLEVSTSNCVPVSQHTFSLKHAVSCTSACTPCQFT